MIFGTVDARDRGEGRFGTRLTALPFERLEHPRFLAADVRAGASVQDDREAPATAEDVGTDETGAPSFLQRRAQDLELGQILAADVDESRARSDGVGGDHDALDEHVRETVHDLPVLEGAGLRLVRVGDEVDRLRAFVGLGQEARLAAHREAGAAPTGDVRREELVDDGLTLHLERLLERRVAAHLLVFG
jgi:hypothetical protein